MPKTILLWIIKVKQSFTKQSVPKTYFYYLLK